MAVKLVLDSRGGLIFINGADIAFGDLDAANDDAIAHGSSFLAGGHHPDESTGREVHMHGSVPGGLASAPQLHRRDRRVQLVPRHHLPRRHV